MSCHGRYDVGTYDGGPDDGGSYDGRARALLNRASYHPSSLEGELCCVTYDSGCGRLDH